MRHRLSLFLSPSHSFPSPFLLLSAFVMMWGLRVLQCCLVAFTLVALTEAASGGHHAAGKSHRRSARKSTRTKKIAQAWYAGWHATEGFPLSDVSWDKYTHLTYAFAITTSSVNNISLVGSDPDILPNFVEEAHKHNVSAAVSIGGWTGSLYFSTNVGSVENRTAFVKTVTDFATHYNLDGIDFDWESPAYQGIGCNTISPNDTANFLLFLQELRTTEVGKRLTLSAATGLTPFYGSSGSPLKNMSAFAKVLDYIEVMDYDVWGSWSSGVGPNSPLNDTCAPSADQVGSAVSAVASWTKAGMPKEKIVLGVASYGHSFYVTNADAFVQGSKTELAAYPVFNASLQPAGDAWDDAAGYDVCGNWEPQGGNFDFWGLVDEGYLDCEGNPEEGIDYRFDTCSQTAYVYNATSNIMISFDDAKAFSAKGRYIKSEHLRGFAMWEAGGDYDDILLDAIRSTGGY